MRRAAWVAVSVMLGHFDEPVSARTASLSPLSACDNGSGVAARASLRRSTRTADPAAARRPHTAAARAQARERAERRPLEGGRRVRAAREHDVAPHGVGQRVHVTR